MARAAEAVTPELQRRHALDSDSNGGGSGGQSRALSQRPAMTGLSGGSVRHASGGEEKRGDRAADSQRWHTPAWAPSWQRTADASALAARRPAVLVSLTARGQHRGAGQRLPAALALAAAQWLAAGLSVCQLNAVGQRVAARWCAAVQLQLLLDARDAAAALGAAQRRWRCWRDVRCLESSDTG